MSTISYYFYAIQKIEVQVVVPLLKSAYVHSKSNISSDKNKITCGFACRFKTCVKYKESAVTIHFNRRKMPLLFTKIHACYANYLSADLGHNFLKSHFLFSRSEFLSGFLRSGFSQKPKCYHRP